MNEEIGFSAKNIMLAHQYLYYVSITPIWTDYEYDIFCKKNNFHGGGGSDCESSYSTLIKGIANHMRRNPSAYDKYK